MSAEQKPHSRPAVDIVREALEHVHYDERDGYTSRAVKEAFENMVERLARYEEPGWVNSVQAVVEARQRARSLEEQLEAAQKAQHVQNLEWAISLAESDPLYAEVFRPYFQKIVDALASNPASGSDDA